MIRLEQLNKVFPTRSGSLRALHDIDLHVPRGRVFGVVGGSGAGKSTLIRCVNLLERPTSGRVFVDGRELTAMSESQLAEARRSIGMVFQHSNLLASRTVAANVALPLELSRTPAAVVRARVRELLELVGITDKHDAWPAQLSGGQRQRATIARALANQPKVLLCDEATSALDPANTRAILALLRTLKETLGLTILLITHEMDVVKAACDEVAIMSEGRIVEQGPVATLFSRATTELAREFIRSSRELALPEGISREPLPNGRPVLRVELSGQRDGTTLIARLARELALDVALLSARTDHGADGGSFGVLLLEIDGGSAELQRAVAFLEVERTAVEIVGYVPTHAANPARSHG